MIRSIWLIEDDSSQLEALSRLSELAFPDYTVIKFDDVAKVDHSLAIAEVTRSVPALIVMDVRLYESRGTSETQAAGGLELVRKIGSITNFAKVPIILHTGFPEDLVEVPANCVLRSKNVEPEELLQTMSGLLVERGHPGMADLSRERSVVPDRMRRVLGLWAAVLSGALLSASILQVTVVPARLNLLAVLVAMFGSLLVGMDLTNLKTPGWKTWIGAIIFSGAVFFAIFSSP